MHTSTLFSFFILHVHPLCSFLSLSIQSSREALLDLSLHNRVLSLTWRSTCMEKQRECSRQREYWYHQRSQNTRFIPLVEGRARARLNESLITISLDYSPGLLLWDWLATTGKAGGNKLERKTHEWCLKHSSLNVTWKDILLSFIWRRLVPHILNSYIVPALAGSHAHASVACYMWCCSLWCRHSFEAKMPSSLSLYLPSLRGCLKIPSLALFTFSLFYRYQEEKA